MCTFWIRKNLWNDRFKRLLILSSCYDRTCQSTPVRAITNRLVYILASQGRTWSLQSLTAWLPQSSVGNAGLCSRAGLIPLHPHTVRPGELSLWAGRTPLKQPNPVAEEFEHCYMEFYLIVAFDRFLFYKGLVVVVSQFIGHFGFS